jgi:type I restriction enzyme S subunit
MEVKKLVPELRFKGFDGEWKIEKLKDISKIERGRFSPRPRNNPIYYNGEIPFVQTSDVVNSNGKIEFFTQTLNEKGLAVSKLFPKGSILITIAANIGYSGVLEIDMACPDSLIGLKPNKNIHNYFLNYFLYTQQPKMDYLAPEGAQKNINIEFLNPYKITITSLPEQQKIASFLSAVDEKIQQLTRKKELLEHYKKGVMQQLFSGKLRFKDENGKDYPDWGKKRLGEYLIHKSIRNKDFKVELVLSVSNKKGFISQGEQFDGYEVASKDLSNYKVVEKDDIAYNPSRINVGSIARLINFEKGIVSPMYVVFSLKTEIDKIFFENLYNIHRFKHLIKVGCSGSVRDSLNFEDLAGFSFNLPCLEEQQKIANFLSSIDAKIESASRQITQTQTFKKGLLQKMFV